MQRRQPNTDEPATHAHTHTYPHTQTHAHTHTHANTHTRARTHIHTQTHANTHIHTHTRAHCKCNQRACARWRVCWEGTSVLRSIKWATSDRRVHAVCTCIVPCVVKQVYCSVAGRVRVGTTTLCTRRGGWCVVHCVHAKVGGV